FRGVTRVSRHVCARTRERGLACALLLLASSLAGAAGVPFRACGGALRRRTHQFGRRLSLGLAAGLLSGRGDLRVRLVVTPSVRIALLTIAALFLAPAALAAGG